MRAASHSIWAAVLLTALPIAAAFGQDGGDIGPDQKWAIVVGVNDYNHLDDLRYCAADAKALRDRLVEGGFREDHVILICDQAQRNDRAPF